MGVNREIDIAISSSIIDETIRVLRDKFNATPAELDSANRLMDACGRKIEPTKGLAVVKDDPNDNHVIECAVAAEAETIVTGDGDLLRMKEYHGICMMRVGEILVRGQ